MPLSEAEGWPMTAKTSITDHDAEPRTQKPENHKGKKGDRVLESRRYSIKTFGTLLSDSPQQGP
jgi:hypothetical protein